MIRLFLASSIDSTFPLLMSEYAIDPVTTPTVYIPTAGNCEVPPRPVDQRGSFQCLIDAHINPLIIKLEDETVYTLQQKLAPIKLIVVGGGNTFFLLQHMQRTQFGSCLKSFFDRGGIYVGSSAGSCVCSPDIAYVSDYDDPQSAPDLHSTHALELVDVDIYPHCIEERFGQSYTDAQLRKMLAHPAKKVILRDHQALVVRDESYRIVDALRS
ncbi:MAG: Type 1 glutamine amidotransferase-like domain-containing protein [Candidatus Roizmanbacteria bacterium]